MAFGSFFKKIINGAQNLVRKAIPVVKKVAETVQKVAPAVSKFGENIDMSADEHALHKIFVGFKNAVEFFEDCRFWIDGRLLDTYRPA